VPYAAARDGLFFARFGRLSPNARVPSDSLILHGVFAALLSVSGTFDQLTNLATLAFVLFWGLSGVALMMLRRTQPDAPRPFRTPLYPYVPLAFVLVMAAILVSAFIENPAESAATFGLLAIGLVLYPLFKSGAPKRSQYAGSPSREASD
jgi:basic amino acid/polyamine antiporter, APA family